MKDGILDAYKLVVEGKDNAGTVSSTATKKAASNASFDGAENKAKGQGAEAAVSSNKIKKAVEAPDKLQGLKEDKEISNMLPKSKFDELFKAQLVEEEGGINPDESPLENTGEDTEFNDEAGDFPTEGGDDVGEEVDVATELRMIIDRLTEVAERLGAYEGEEGAEGLEDEGPMEEPTEPPVTEAAGPGKGAADGKLKPGKDASKTLQGPTKSNIVKSAFKVTSGKAKNSAGPGKGAHDGKLSPAKKTTLGPKMSMKADAKGPMGKEGAGIFDAV